MKYHNQESKNIAIIGGSAASCVLALYLNEKKNCKVTIFEKSKSLGGAWQFDKGGAKFSNIIYPLNAKEKKIYKKSIKFLKKYRIKFRSNIKKSLFSKKTVLAKSCDLNGLYNLAKRKINIKKNTQVKSIKEFTDYILINNKFKFSHVFFPTYIKLKKIHLIKENGKNKTVNIPYLKINKALHTRILVKNLKNQNWSFKENKIGPMDRFQVINKNKNISQINGRILLEWKGKSKNLIIKNIKSVLNFDRLLSANFFSYRSCIRNSNQIKKLKQVINKTRRIKYLETFTFLEFLRESIFRKKFLKTI